MPSCSMSQLALSSSPLPASPQTFATYPQGSEQVMRCNDFRLLDCANCSRITEDGLRLHQFRALQRSKKWQPPEDERRLQLLPEFRLSKAALGGLASCGNALETEIQPWLRRDDLEHVRIPRVLQAHLGQMSQARSAK